MLGAMRAQRNNHALAATAAKQHRIFSRIQAFESGFSEEDLKYRVDTQTLHRVADAMGGRGVAGSARLKAVLAERLPGDPVPESRLERMFLALCDSAGIRRPELQVPVPGWDRAQGRVDCMFRPER